MSALHKATEHLLLKAGLLTVASSEFRCPVFYSFVCGDEHDWSKTQTDVPGEPPYQFCRDCGRVRRSPWAPGGSP